MLADFLILIVETGQSASSAMSSSATSSSTQSGVVVVGAPACGLGIVPGGVSGVGVGVGVGEGKDGGRDDQKTVHQLAAKSVIRDFERLAMKELLHLAGDN